jgi:hypothetical protein
MFYTKYDFDDYWRSSSEGRKKVFLDAIQRSVLEVCQLRGWDCEPFHSAYRSLIERDLRSEFSWPKAPVSSPDRKRRAQILPGAVFILLKLTAFRVPDG